MNNSIDARINARTAELRKEFGHDRAKAIIAGGLDSELISLQAQALNQRFRQGRQSGRPSGCWPQQRGNHRRA